MALPEVNHGGGAVNEAARARSIETIAALCDRGVGYAVVARRSGVPTLDPRVGQGYLRQRSHGLHGRLPA